MNLSLELQQFVSRFQLQLPVLPDRQCQYTRQAAILIPIINRSRPTLLLTQRSFQLRHHAGQVAFPGGSADKSDLSVIATALRETQEELALNPQHIQVLGRLPPQQSSSGFQVTPVVALLDANINPIPCDKEVAALFEIPLDEALNLSQYHWVEIQQQGNAHRLYFLCYRSFLIWGLTATIIRKLAQQTAPPG